MEETIAEIDHQVVALIRAERRQHPVAAADERSENDRLCAVANVTRMLRQGLTWLR
jgi:hypothetical protein